MGRCFPQWYIDLIKFLMHKEAPHHLPPQWDGNRETRLLMVVWRPRYIIGLGVHHNLSTGRLYPGRSRSIRVCLRIAFPIAKRLPEKSAA